jgi:transcriptional regulator GlxA family with amidase domain
VTESGLPLHLGVVLYPGFEPLDVFGPVEMFINVGAERLVIHMIAERAGLVPASGGGYPESLAPKVHADHSFDDAPPLDVILVPGGFGTLAQLGNERLFQWLRDRAPRARLVTSVCSGSAILAKAGLLDGRKATSNKQVFSFLAAQGPAVDWQKSARWVEDGAMVTSSGVSAGMDMALAVIEKLFGVETAERIAAATEYEWRRDPSEDPFTRYLDQGLAGLRA